jgi:hypothetical protein
MEETNNLISLKEYQEILEKKGYIYSLQGLRRLIREGRINNVQKVGNFSWVILDPNEVPAKARQYIKNIEGYCNINQIVEAYGISLSKVYNDIRAYTKQTPLPVMYLVGDELTRYFLRRDIVIMYKELDNRTPPLGFVSIKDEDLIN